MSNEKELTSGCCGSSGCGLCFETKVCHECKGHCEYIEPDDDEIAFADGTPIAVDAAGMIQLPANGQNWITEFGEKMYQNGIQSGRIQMLLETIERAEARR